LPSPPMPPSAPSPFLPADAGKYWEGTVTFDLLVRYAVRANTPNTNMVAYAVKKTLAEKGFPSVNGRRRLQTSTQPVVEVTATIKVAIAVNREGQYQETFAVTVKAFAPMLHAIREAVSLIAFWDKFNEYVKEGYKGVKDCFNPVTLIRLTSGCSEVLGGAEFTLDDEQKTVQVDNGLIGPGPIGGEGPSAQTTIAGGIPVWVIPVFILIFLCMLWPVLCWYYAKLKYGTGKERIWLQLMFSHSNMAFPLLYKPKEQRKQLRTELYSLRQKREELDEASRPNTNPQEAPAAAEEAGSQALDASPSKKGRFAFRSESTPNRSEARSVSF